ncbi:MAG: YadA-like family protein [Phascolarctobacterium sp.]|nr:YadA-like family protein [Phascolarctobacterium sp.]
MKKNLVKRIVLGLLTGAVLMSSSVAWADGLIIGTHTGQNSILITMNGGHAYMDNSIFIGNNGGVGQMNGGVITSGSGENGVAIGEEAKVIAAGGVALGADTTVSKVGSVALGYGSIASEEYVVSVGSGNVNDAYATRKIVNVTKGELDTDAATYGQVKEVDTRIGATIGTVDYHGDNSVIPNATNTLTGAISVLSSVAKNNQDDIGSVDFRYNTTYITNSEDLTDAAKDLDAQVKINADAIAGKADKDYVDNNFVRITTVGSQNIISSSITIQENNSAAPITIGAGGITVGEQSTHMDEEGFYACDNGNHTYAGANAAMSKDGKIKGAAGKFEVGTEGQLKAANGKFEVDDKGNVIGGTYNGVDIRALADSVASNDAVAGLNQRLEKTNAKINKVGAGAAALAALHPLDYDPDDKLTFSAGMGNYAGENAAALGAFYRPNEKFMLSLGGTMGNGENMVNLGLSIGLDKASGFAKMSKRELIQEINAVKAENEAMKDQLANADERIAKLEALVAQLVAK